MRAEALPAARLRLGGRLLAGALLGLAIALTVVAIALIVDGWRGE